MVQLPIGFFMPLPLPVMIPFMMWQSAAIAAGFGTYFQFAKRKVSAMSNEEFNRANPHQLVDDLYEDIVKNMPSSFAKIDSMTPIILDSMLKMLTNAVDWFAGVLGGTGLTDLQRRLAGGGFNPFDTPSPVGGGEIPKFEAGQIGQATIPSTAWLNNLDRSQLKAIRNDALRGDYTPDSKTLILARYKDVFEFERGQENLTSPVGKNIKAFIPTKNVQSVLGQLPSSWPGIGRLLYDLILKQTTSQAMYRKMGQALAGANAQLKASRSPQAIKKYVSQKKGVESLIVQVNKLLSKGLPFKL